MHRKLVGTAVLWLAGSIGSAGAQAPSQPITAQLQKIIDSYLSHKQKDEKITGIALQVSLDEGKR